MRPARARGGWREGFHAAARTEWRGSSRLTIDARRNSGDNRDIRTTERRDVMPLSREAVERLFAEQVGRDIPPDVAEAVAAVAGPIIDGLNAIDPEPLWLVEPSTVFEPRYPAERSDEDELL
ncbi:hypothetical protein Sthe_2521 [Sphaerobacter thermophilus DSM 20745]|uniref:Uncharacterized protein n=2 Tax=Sphaerobacteraceae TaxID=85002 RepID=D1CAY9_SPHTD|nr:hypothetical protein Sthe_2521 [Sphaerobacter thermophilus DSM 20745]